MNIENNFKYVNVDVNRAWEGGKNVIQYRIISGNSPTEWVDLPPKAPVMPNFLDPNVEWRIKPLEYRIALCYDKNVKKFTTELYSKQEYNDNIEQRSSFVKWVTDWTEVDV
jgi:hypothetical protein